MTSYHFNKYLSRERETKLYINLNDPYSKPFVVLRLIKLFWTLLQISINTLANVSLKCHN